MRCLWQVVLLGVFQVMVVSGSQSPEVREQKSLERGEEYLKAGKFNEAIIELRNALLVDPDFVLALHVGSSVRCEVLVH